MELKYNTRKLIMTLLPVQLIEQIRMGWQLRKNTSPVLILQLGKVGSSSIYNGLLGSKFRAKHPVYHLHYITPSGVLKKKQFYEERKTYIRRHLIVGKILSEFYENNKTPFAYIVCAVRNPLEREISGFFENYPQTHPELTKYIGEELGVKSVEVLSKHFRDNAKAICDELDDWFDDEIKKTFDVDVFKSPYDNKIGYLFLESKCAKFVLFKIEHLNSFFSDGMQALTGERIELGSRNIGDKKEYSEAYGYVKKNLRLEPEVMDVVSSSRVMRSFYADELNRIKNRWQKQA